MAMLVLAILRLRQGIPNAIRRASHFCAIAATTIHLKPCSAATPPDQGPPSAAAPRWRPLKWGGLPPGEKKDARGDVPTLLVTVSTTLESGGISTNYSVLYSE